MILFNTRARRVVRLAARHLRSYPAAIARGHLQPQAHASTMPSGGPKEKRWQNRAADKSPRFCRASRGARATLTQLAKKALRITLRRKHGWTKYMRATLSSLFFL